MSRKLWWSMTTKVSFDFGFFWLRYVGCNRNGEWGQNSNSDDSHGKWDGNKGVPFALQWSSWNYKEGELQTSHRFNDIRLGKLIQNQNKKPHFLFKETNFGFLLFVDWGFGPHRWSAVSPLVFTLMSHFILKAFEEEQPAPDNRVEWELFFSPGDEKVFRFLRDFHDVNQQFGELTLFTPFYITYLCPACLQPHEGHPLANENCVSGGQYCIFDPGTLPQNFPLVLSIISLGSSDRAGPLNGKDMVNETLRELCVYNQSHAAWWDYIRSFHDNCFVFNQEYNSEMIVSDIAGCSLRILDSLAPNFSKEAVLLCVEQSYLGDYLLAENTLLKEQQAEVLRRNVLLSPSLFINTVPYRVNFPIASSFLDSSSNVSRSLKWAGKYWAQHCLRCNLRRLFGQARNLRENLFARPNGPRDKRGNRWRHDTDHHLVFFSGFHLLLSAGCPLFLL